MNNNWLRTYDYMKQHVTSVNNNWLRTYSQMNLVMKYFVAPAFKKSNFLLKKLSI